MNRRSVILFASCAFAATSAQAQSNRDNDVLINQIGSDNSAIITQAGIRNLAGSDADPMLQDGIYNALTISQTGTDNTIGLTLPGILQIGRRNTPGIFNTIDLLQNSDENAVGSIEQISEGSVVNGANALTVIQQNGDRNLLRAVRQVQESGEAAQRASVTMTGADNIIDRVEQRSNDTGREGPNEIDVNILGSNNGRLALSGFAAEPSLADSSIVQEADTVDPGIYGNKIILDIIGDDNRFGLRQGGRMNDMGRLVLNGNRNQIGFRQDGTENNIQMAVVEGDDNEIGIDQIVTNIAQVDLIGLSNANRIYAFQQGTNMLEVRIEGDTNTLRTRQDYLSGTGGDNDATVTMTGNLNFADLEQLGDNVFSLAIAGDRNNAGGPFSGAAASGALTPGVFSQIGAGNVFSGVVTGSDNLMAAAQTGNANTITALVAGDSNQAAFVQMGNANIAFLDQNGSGNVAGVYQN
ncbi:hypothetical protein KDD17_07510 [Sulfitobacter albidus]|uniref:Curlin associated repeat-containing protein n=1 Tax=Sulfitobacter albidus TaxID=2829501 RepID=A0A975PNX7_9RHOB|nr:hypothetical protein [Sulfitobacter albidus]QUJ77780.1 hypothetical protein KDD17_07510 [Sulfitobacter albidus]